jgi:hypothetical protein
MKGYVEPQDAQFKHFDGKEVMNFHPSQPLKVAANLPVNSSNGQVEKATKELGSYACSLTSLGVPAKNLDQIPGDTIRFEYAFDVSKTKHFINVGKKDWVVSNSFSTHSMHHVVFPS